MKQLTISFAAPVLKREYPIYIGSHLIESIGKFLDVTQYSRIYLITDENVASLYLAPVKKQFPHAGVSILPPGEKAKDVSYLTELWESMIAAKLDRKSLILNLGGGVIGDIGGFAASTYMRGIDFINIPTTLLAQVDESVGGKTMIDLQGIKNIVGTFYQPSAVIIDVNTLQSLPEKQLLSGFAEIIKHGLIHDRKYFELVTNKRPQNFSSEEMTEIIKKSCEIKASIVQLDEKEIGLRKLLNFGHTVGHAIEALSLDTHEPLLHGEAISIGMVKEAELALALGLLSQKDASYITGKLRESGLPTELPKMKPTDILDRMMLDKKNTRGEINFTLLTGIGQGIINQVIAEDTIIKVLTKS